MLALSTVLAIQKFKVENLTFLKMTAVGHLKHDISATTWPTVMKFGETMHIGTRCNTVYQQF